MSQAFAGAFLSLATWWMTQTSPATPEEMDEMFHRMVWSGAVMKAPAENR
jgi:hypothetical protein